jgi:choline dehydrogenase
VARGYLASAAGRPNLTILTGALARAIRLEGRRAVGVDYLRAGRAESARAEREVILCGGAFNSPQLLQLSGIGPAAHLAKLGIAVRHDLPGVGAHPISSSSISAASPSASIPRPGRRGNSWWGCNGS